MEQFEKFNNIFNQSDNEVYVSCSNKVRSNKNFYTYDAALKFKQVGWWIQEDIIVVDVDTKKDANRLYRIIKGENIKCFITQSVKGAHFYFKKPKNVLIKHGSNKNTSIGIEYDPRVGGKGYMILPYNQEDRRWMRTTSNLDVLPPFLYPQNTLKTEDDFNELGANSGRNDTLFRHYQSLIDYAKNMSIKDKQNAIRIINKYLFKKSLSEDELVNTVIREELTEAFDDPEAIDNSANYDADIIANKMIRDYKIITKNQLTYMYQDGYYKELTDTKLHHTIHHDYDKKAKEHKRKEIAKFLALKTDVNGQELNGDLLTVNCANGRVDVRDLKLKEHGSDYLDTIRIHHNFNPAAKPSATLKKFLTFIADGQREKLNLLYEMIGFCFVRKIIKEKIFFLVGEKGANGKSTFLEILENLLGDDNTSSADLGDIARDEYVAAELYLKLANIGDDLKLGALKETGIIKTLVSGKLLAANVKYKDRFRYKNYATLIFAANRIPISYDKSSAFVRRFTIIRFDKTVAEADRDYYLVDKITPEDYEFLLMKGLKGVHNVIKSGSMTKLDENEEELNKYIKENSSVMSFLDDSDIEKVYFEKKPSVRDLYSAYKEYCIESGHKNALQKNIFNAEVHSKFPIDQKKTTRNGTKNCLRWVLK